jgi:hypothetical protein
VSEAPPPPADLPEKPPADLPEKPPADLPEKPSIWLRISCVLVLASLALIGFAIVYPAPLAVIAAMSIGQGIGTIGAAIFLWIVVRDLRRAFNAKAAKDSAKELSASKPRA